MTEQPDTAAIRATYADDAAEFPGGTAWQFMRLADALDAARAESEALRREQIHAVRLAEAAEARIAAIHPDWWTMAEDLATAEAKNVEMGQRMDALAHRHDALDERTAELTEHLQAAEANLAEQERVTRLLEGALKSAEARIAAVLAACSDWESGDHWSPEALLRAVRRALTEVPNV